MGSVHAMSSLLRPVCCAAPGLRSSTLGFQDAKQSADRLRRRREHHLRKGSAGVDRIVAVTAIVYAEERSGTQRDPRRRCQGRGLRSARFLLQGKARSMDDLTLIGSSVRRSMRNDFVTDWCCLSSRRTSDGLIEILSCTAIFKASRNYNLSVSCHRA